MFSNTLLNLAEVLLARVLLDVLLIDHPWAQQLLQAVFTPLDGIF
ncbi:hypothetical protein [Prochlorococcus marinus]|uniref:Uncharacterized protein n=1 Tax=Prochlorococcus marinus (strain MIT 9303) TaxID=59922 RepID=A2CBD9_PROM3|nr:hypothetical protein [Prochlorococcus marinus]ABM78799.1 Conserved hypothetical protein [Prochlorococcus marinus str. MIT 9303]